MSVAKMISLEDAERRSSKVEPSPLFPPIPPGKPYPVDALGPQLGQACLAISRKVQVPHAIAGQSVLAVASHAAQPLANVLLPSNQTRPLSIYAVTIAASGDRKTSTDSEAGWPIKKREKALREHFDIESEDWRIKSAAWRGTARKIENGPGDYQAKQTELAALGAEPVQPLHPMLIAPEPTIEGLAKLWTCAPASLALFSAEGGQFLGGYGMSQDHKLKTAAALSELWDGRGMRRVRAGDGISDLQGRRLAVHLMVQADAANAFLSDRVLRDQGLLSRVLVAFPDSIAGTRIFREPDEDDERAIKAYGRRILDLLEKPWPFAEGKRNELDPKTLLMTAEAQAAWVAFYNHVEGQGGSTGKLAAIQDFASKAAEHAARIAGVLAIINNADASHIDLATMACAITLADWYLGEAQRLQQASQTDPKLLQAQRLLDWIRAHGKETAFRDICQNGPAATRTKAAAEQAIGILMNHGWLIEVSSRPLLYKLTD